jgi:beta-N-acetylhexosaminidase
MEAARDPLRAQWVATASSRPSSRRRHRRELRPPRDLVEPETHPILATASTARRAHRRTPPASAPGAPCGRVLPVLKHIPGYGRARVDSHKDLPRVSAPREELRRATSPPSALARHPPRHDRPHRLRRRGPRPPLHDLPHRDPHDPGGAGLRTASDDRRHWDGALSGTHAQRAAASLEAGVDIVLHCKGDARGWRTQ